MRPGAGKKALRRSVVLWEKRSEPFRLRSHTLFRFTKENQALPLMVISPASALALPMGP